MTKFSPSTLVHPYAPACVLRVAGPDAPTFLQSQFTNDLSNISPGQAVYGLWLDQKGRVLADSHVVRDVASDAFWVVSITSDGSAVARHLEDHIIADEVSVSNETGGWRGIALVGPGTGEWFRTEPRPGFAFPGRRTAGESWEWIFPAKELVSAAGAASAGRAADRADIERLRIEALIPSVPADIGPGDLPNEGGLDRLAISYSKGCYTGQEVMARVRSLGRVRRALVRVRGDGAPPPLPAALWLGDKKEGQLRSAERDASGYAGLALVSVAGAREGALLALAQNAEPTVTIDRLP